jgi:hypothetical protein
LKVHGAVGVRQTEIHRAEPFVPELSASEFEGVIGNLKSYKSPGVDQVPAELIQAGWETLRSEIHKLIKLIWNKEELPHQWKESIVVPIHERVIKLTVLIIEAYHWCQLHTKFCQIFFSLGLRHTQMKLLGMTSVDSGVIDQRLTNFSIFGR